MKFDATLGYPGEGPRVADDVGEDERLPLLPLPFVPFPVRVFSGAIRSEMRTSKAFSLNLRENMVVDGVFLKTRVQQKQPADL